MTENEANYKKVKVLNKTFKNLLYRSERLREFEAIGTIEEFKALKEKNEPKKPIRVSDYTLFELWHCPSCTTYVAIDTCCCEKCGQRLNWSE